MDKLPCAIVLAGGKSSRFGSNKVYASAGGLSLIDLCVSNLLELFEQIIVVAKDTVRFSVEAIDRIQMIYDESPIYASMIGLSTGLQSSHCQINYVVGCDMPLLAPDLIRELYKLAAGRDCAIKCDEYGTPQPLGGFYSKTCLALIGDMIASEDYKLINLIKRSNASLLQYEEVLKLDPLLKSFYNVNTPDDIKLISDVIADL